MSIWNFRNLQKLYGISFFNLRIYTFFQSHWSRRKLPVLTNKYIMVFTKPYSTFSHWLPDSFLQSYFFTTLNSLSSPKKSSLFQSSAWQNIPFISQDLCQMLHNHCYSYHGCITNNPQTLKLKSTTDSVCQELGQEGAGMAYSVPSFWDFRCKHSKAENDSMAEK